MAALRWVPHVATVPLVYLTCLCCDVCCLQESKLKSMSLRSNLAICRGESKDVMYRCMGAA
jgi:hypothetical protein